MKYNVLILFLNVISLTAIVAQPARYYKTQMHCHSTNSDGELTPSELATEYRNRGYEVLFISDHNIMTHADSIHLPGILCFNAEEYTFAKHINGFFLDHTVDARGFTAQQAVDSIKSQGGLVMFNHPVKIQYGPDWSYPVNYFDENRCPDFIEIFNTLSAIIAPINIGIWDYLLSRGQRIYGVATDDLHKIKNAGMIEMIDVGWIMLKLNSLNKDSVFNALKRGDFYASTGIDINNFNVIENDISISCTNCSKIKFIGNNGKILKEVKGSEADFSRNDEKYVRVELEDNGILGVRKKKAWTQPVFYDNTTNELFAEIRSLSMKCYPNPFITNLTISYTLAIENSVLVQIYDYTGKLIKTLVDEHQQQGDYCVQFDGTGIDKGIYYCKLITSNQTLTSKVIMM